MKAVDQTRVQSEKERDADEQPPSNAVASIPNTALPNSLSGISRPIRDEDFKVYGVIDLMEQ